MHALSCGMHGMNGNMWPDIPANATEGVKDKIDPGEILMGQIYNWKHS